MILHCLAQTLVSLVFQGVQCLDNRGPPEIGGEAICTTAWKSGLLQAHESPLHGRMLSAAAFFRRVN
jgi:hypothetical protein